MVQGELVFVTSKECKDVTESQAKDYILGYTIGNDLTCRMFQLPGNMSGQFFFAKAFDHFAPIGPVLISPKLFESVKRNGLTLKVNGEVRQKADLHNDMIFSPERILSHMSQGTTIPAGTAVMTGTCEGVGAFRKPKVFLQQGDVVEVSMPLAGTLRNTIKLE
jgi:2-keto-4-pentenoate hydratase/2-oxohepta-3-ene-1,7-dioic acid hydratase in catechol pathway